MSDDVLNKKDEKKFFFNMNIFDEDHVVEEPPPPPPVFSEEDLEAAKKAAYSQGKQDGIKEATEKEQNSRATLVAQAIDILSNDTETLFNQEHGRAILYEKEAVALSLKIFETIFPDYHEKLGFNELKAHIQSVLRKQQGAHTITIHTSDGNAPGIEELISTLNTQGRNGTLEVTSDASMPDSACRLSWKQGGSDHNTQKLAEQIQSLVQQTLAGTAANSHDGKSGDAPQDESAPKDDTEAESADDKETTGET